MQIRVTKARSPHVVHRLTKANHTVVYRTSDEEYDYYEVTPYHSLSGMIGVRAVDEADVQQAAAVAQIKRDQSR